MATNIYKTVTYVINNDAKGRDKIKNARRQINTQQQDSAVEICNLLMGWGGLFNAAVAIVATAFNGVTIGYTNYLEKWEDLYTMIYEDMSTYTPETSSNISYVKISYDLIGTKDKYKAGLPRYTYHKN